MFVRHLKKFNNQAELQAALAAGTIASPYVAIDSSDNVANMVMPSDQEPADIEYTQEEEPTPVPAGPITISDYGVRSMFTKGINKYADLKFTAYVEFPEESDGSDLYLNPDLESTRFGFVRKDFFNYALNNYFEDMRAPQSGDAPDYTGKVIAHLLNDDILDFLPNWKEDYPSFAANVYMPVFTYSEWPEGSEDDRALRRPVTPEEVYPYTVYCWTAEDNEFTAPVPLTPFDASANPDMYTWIIIAGYAQSYDGYGTYFVANDGAYCYKLNELVIPDTQENVILSSPIISVNTVGTTDGDPLEYLVARLKFNATAAQITNAQVKDDWFDENSEIHDWGNSNSVRYMFVRQQDWDDAIGSAGDDPLDLNEEALKYYCCFFADYGDSHEYEVSADSSGYISNFRTREGSDCMQVPESSNALEDSPADYTYYLVASYIFDPDNDESYILCPDYSYFLGTYTIPVGLIDDASSNLLKLTGEINSVQDSSCNYAVSAIQNSVYPQVGVGVYSKNTFDSQFERSGYDSSIAFLEEFRDGGSMIENVYDTDPENGFWPGDEIDITLLPGGYTGYDDTICLAAWFIDDEGNALAPAYMNGYELEDSSSGDDSSIDSVRLGAITPSYEQDDNHDTYGLLKASLTFDIQADEIENANMAYGVYGWPFIYFINKSDFDSHYNGYLSENPGTTFADYVYLIVQGEESVNYFSASTDAEVPYEPTDGWVDSSVSYYSDSTTVPPEYDAYYENSCTHYIVAMYTDGQWNILDPASYPDAFVDLGTYTVQPHTIDSSLETDLVTGRGAINGETIEGTTYYNTRHQDFNVTATPNTVFDRVVCGVYSSAYYNVLYDNYINDTYSEEQARDLALSGMCTQVHTLDSTTSAPNVDSSMELVDNVNCSVSYTGYDDMLYLSGYFYSSQDNSLRTDWIDFAYLNLPEAPDSSQGGDSSIDASSNAYISSFVQDLANSWYDDQEGVQHDCYYPVIEMFNNDASMNMFQFGSYAQSDFDNYRNNYNSLEEFYEAYAQSYIDLSTIFDGSTNASWETEAWLEFDTANISEGDYLVFIGRYVNADAEETLYEWDNPVTVYTVNESKAWLSLGEYPNSAETSPCVDSDNYYDDGAGTITFDAYLNDDAIAAGATHYSIGITSDSMMQTAMENAMMNQEMFDPDAWMIAQCSGTYTGDSAAPNSITLNYSTSFDDQGQVIAVMYDSGDNIIQNYNGGDYTTIDGWQYSVPPEEPMPEPPIE